MNHSKKPEVFKVFNDGDRIMDDPVLEMRLELSTIVNKTIKTRFHTFTLNDIKILSWSQRSKTFTLGW